MEAIAIIGMSCRLPGANNLEAFWTLLSEGIDAISEIPSDRWPIEAFYDAEPGKPGKMSSRWAGLIENIDRFDADFFGISPREAKAIDPQQRLALELTWEALADAAIAPTSLAGSRTSVFMGAATCDYHHKIYRNLETIGPYQGVGTSFSIVANRISYLFNLRGVSTTIDTACSSSLVALHLACQSLSSGESDLSLVGGVNAILSPELMINFSQARMMAKDGRCRTFDAQASGYVRAEGGGIVVLKRLSDALSDGDIVRAVIKGTAVNQDGLTNGLTAPNGLAQQAVIEEALARSGCAPAAISYLETHGTGTPLGDPIEVRALKTVLSKGRTPEQKCWFGSVKTNIGHLEAAAGLASLIKVVLSLENDHIPPHLHLKELNPYISLKETPFAIPTEGQPWLRGEQPRYAGVSAFGYGGTNAHVIISEAPPSSVAEPHSDRPLSLFTLSAKSATALAESAQRYTQWLDSGKKAQLPDICYSVNLGRTHFKHRLAATVESKEQLQRELAEFVQGKSIRVKTGTASNKPPKIAFLFSGQGTQYLQMAEELYRLETPFQATLDRCAKILDPQLDRPLLEILYGKDQALDQTLYTQPALFALEYALSSLWQFWGIEPQFVCGHSLGEYVAACVAGAISLETALTLVVERSRLMQHLPLDGGMSAVFAGEEEVAEIIRPYEDRVAIAAVNAPQKTTISGLKATLTDLEKILNAKGIETRPLAVSHAFHSPLLEPILDRLEEIANRFSYHPPQKPLISNLTGDFFNPQQAPNATYWREHSRQPVRFAQGIHRLLEAGCEIFLEIGPHPTLSRLGKESSPDSATLSWLTSLVRGKSDWQTLLDSLSALYVKGASINWANFEKGTGGKRLCSLPAYPFQRQRYWWEEEETEQPTISLSDPLKSNAVSVAGDRTQEILATLQSILGQALEIPSDRLDPKTSLLEIGADSIIFIDLGQKLEQRYGVQISLRQLFEDLKTIEALSHYIDQQLPPDWKENKETPSTEAARSAIAPSPAALPVSATTATEQIIAQQVQMMQQQLDLFSQQLQLLGGKPSQSPLPERPAESNGKATAPPKAIEKPKIAPPESKQLSPQQQNYLEAFIDRYTQRTRQSKQRVKDSRAFLADRRASVGFRRETKELLYPIVGERFAGSRFWDIDGNEYVDISMGFGVHLLGHRVPFIVDAINEQLETGAQTGPQSALAAEVARAIALLTGMERVCFSNSGTEAVMTALRLARAVSGRNKIVIFKGAYHGHFDGTLAIRQPGEEGKTAPMAPGILPNMVADVLLLNYDDPSSIEIIRSQAGELAAVLVEPIPSRQPDVQPQAFLKQLRDVTQQADIALIFDEVITGFRLHPQGAQGWFGVEADLATYGKALGGGLPIGVVAGKSKYLDAIDGGAWHYGDDSFPEVETTFFAGTFSKHPLAMASARAVLQHLESQGGALQANLNQRTEKLTEALQSCFDRCKIPVQILRCGSIFRFRYGNNSSYLFQPLEMDLFYSHLIEKGIYIWEGRTCFLSTAHDDRDLEAIVAAVEESVQELRSGGFFQGTTPASYHAPLTLPLTDAQQQLWLLTQMAGNEGSLAYIISTALKLQGELNRKALDRALHTVINRHEALRARIDPEGKQQKITRIALTAIEETDVSHLSLAQRELQIAQWFERDNQEPFNLALELPLRVRLLKVEETVHLLLLSAHHILVDGWSLGVIVTELGELYRGLCQGIDRTLKPPLQWSDYTSWLQQQLSKEKMQRDRAYWLQQLSGSLPVLDLPSDRPRPPLKTYSGDRQTCKLDSHLTAQIKTLAQNQGCTPFMVLLSVNLILLHRLTGQEDILIGIPAAGRTLTGSTNLVGYCAHLLPISSKLQGAPSFPDYLAAIQKTLLSAYDHQDYPFARLIADLDIKRDPSRSPLVSATFNLERSILLPELPALKVELADRPLKYAHFDFHLNLTEANDELVIDADYNCHLFDRETIARWLGHFQTLLQGVVACPSQSVRTLPLLTPAEREQIASWNHTQVNEQALCLHELFEEQVERTPDAIAVSFAGENLTYRQLNDRADCLARYLPSFGVKPEVLVGVCLERSLEMVVALLGILKAGGAYVPLDPSFPQERLAYIIGDAAAPVILTQSHLLKNLPANTQTLCLDQDWAAIKNDCPEQRDCPSPSANLENLAYVIYTSGSTGKPKGAANEHRGICNRLQWMQSAYPLTADDRVLQKTPYSFDVSVWEFFWPLSVGARLVIAKPEGHKDTTYLAETIVQEGITTIHFVPSMLSAFLEDPKAKACHSLQRTICSGEALSVELQNRFFNCLDSELHNLYGPTEAAIDVSFWQCRRENRSGKVPIGRPIANVQLHVLDPYLQPVPVGVAGELHIGGVAVGRGYWQKPELTQEKFIPNPFSSEKETVRDCAPRSAKGDRLYKTGDLVRYLPDGNLEFLGRLDRQVKVRGLRIELGEIEAVLSQHPAVKETVTIDREDKNTQDLVAYCVPKQGVSLDIADLRGFLKQHLPEYMIPSAYVLLEAMPLLPNGKIDRRSLPIPDQRSSAGSVVSGWSTADFSTTNAQQNYIAPRNEREAKIAEIWQQLLGCDRIGVEDNFFELGGHSLHAVQLVSRVREAFGVNLQAGSVLQAPTIASQSQLVETAHWVANSNGGVVVEREEGEI